MSAERSCSPAIWIRRERRSPSKVSDKVKWYAARRSLEWKLSDHSPLNTADQGELVTGEVGGVP